MRTTVLTLLLAVGLVAVTSAADPDAVEVPADVTIDQLSYWFAAVEFSHGDHNDMADDCTACHPDRYYSYRRDGAGTGRMISFVGYRTGSPG